MSSGVSTPDSCPRETPTTVLPSSSCSPHGITPQGHPSVSPPLFPPHSRTHRACAYTHHVLCRLNVCAVCSGDAASGTSARTACFSCCGRGVSSGYPLGRLEAIPRSIYGCASRTTHCPTEHPRLELTAHGGAWPLHNIAITNPTWGIRGAKKKIRYYITYYA